MASRPMTDALAAEIKRMAHAEPQLHQHEIAARLEINQGRVSEVLSGKRFSHVPGPV